MYIYTYIYVCVCVCVYIYILGIIMNTRYIVCFTIDSRRMMGISRETFGDLLKTGETILKNNIWSGYHDNETASQMQLLISF